MSRYKQTSDVVELILSVHDVYIRGNFCAPISANCKKLIKLIGKKSCYIYPYIRVDIVILWATRLFWFPCNGIDRFFYSHFTKDSIAYKDCNEIQNQPISLSATHCEDPSTQYQFLPVLQLISHVLLMFNRSIHCKDVDLYPRIFLYVLLN